jgi:GNAT superfamily N-acetyltransferase
MARETENYELDQSLIHAGVASLLADPGMGRYWVAEVDDEVVGQIMVTYEFSDWRNGVIWWIQSVYVHEDQRRKGVYTALYRYVESLARADEDVVGLRLYVEKNNARAQLIYGRLGMSLTEYRIMELDFRKENQDRS